jgi:DNA ligase-associated metallophosphoesterase
LKNSLEILLLGNRLILLPERAVFFPENNTLILSDLHLGKVNHFRKAGIPVPVRAGEATLEALVQLLMIIRPARTIFLGDLFHSHYNTAWDAFGKIIESFSDIGFDLVAGNHDILSDYQYQKAGIKLHHEIQISDNFILRHEATNENSDKLFQICGHIHPSVILRSKSLQSEKFPCYWVSGNSMTLPAFGEFTGTHSIMPKKSDRIFFIAGKKVIDAQSLSAPA